MLLIRFFLILSITVWLVTPNTLQAASPEVEEIPWATEDVDGNLNIHLYFFWSEHCPHCQEARPFIEALPDQYSWLKIHAFNLSGNEDNSILYQQMAAELGEEAISVPAFLFCGAMITGYGGPANTGAFLTENLERCYQSVLQSEEASTAENVEISNPTSLKIPLLGEFDPQSLSLPVLTVVLAGMDSFNPCAFFVLLFLLSLLVHARSRARMLAIGVTFVLLSGLIYFMFMATWLNIFMFIGQMQWITLATGLLALVVALINIKDYFWFRKGVSLSISDQAKPHLFQRMRGLVNADSLPNMMIGTVVLAVMANLYELLCTAGFPMVFTRILTLHELAPTNYYAYLAFYNLIYIIPLMIIVIIFAVTLGARKLSETQGRNLKLLSGLMMLGLGLILLFAPNALNNILTAILLFLSAIIITLLVTHLAP